LTIVSSDESSATKEKADTSSSYDHPLDSIRDMFADLRGCWLPLPKDQAHSGTEYTIRFALKRDGTLIAMPRRVYSSHDIAATTRDIYRDAIDAALKRCFPLHLVQGWRAVAGRPIAIRFVDNRALIGDRTLPVSCQIGNRPQL
jgi:hypothetical protein